MSLPESAAAIDRLQPRARTWMVLSVLAQIARLLNQFCALGFPKLLYKCVEARRFGIELTVEITATLNGCQRVSGCVPANALLFAILSVSLVRAQRVCALRLIRCTNLQSLR